MKLDYFTLLSPYPIYLNQIGSIKSPTLREISNITYYTYRYYLSNLLLEIDSYYEFISKNDYAYLNNFNNTEKEIILKVQQEYNALDKEKKKEFSFYNILVFDHIMINSMVDTFNFFFVDNVIYDEKNRLFLLMDGSVNNDGEPAITGVIHEKNYDDVIDVILQRVNVKKDNEFKKAKPKNKIAEKILNKLQNSSINKLQKKKDDEKMELANLISSLSIHGGSYNLINIWDLTIFQFYDQFTRTRIDDSHKMNTKSVSVWGDKEKKYNDTAWFSVIHEKQ